MMIKDHPELILNRSNSESYLERSFREWLIKNNLKQDDDFITNKHFKINEKIYFGDFYFPKLSLLIELDGKQHLDSTEYDSNRDFNFRSVGIETIRISHKEYKNKSKESEIAIRLGLHYTT